MAIKYLFLSAIITLAMGLQVVGQESSGYSITSDSTESNYENYDQFGGPKSIGAQLKADNEKKESFFRVPIRVMSPWYAWKKKLNENTGIQIGINYTSLYMNSSVVMDKEINNPNAASGVFDFQMAWNAIGRKSGKNKGTFSIKINSRHAFGNLTAPMFHGITESGYYGLSGTGYHDYSLRIIELHYSQMLFNDKLGFVIGKIDPSNYYDFHGLSIPWTAFIGYGSQVSGTANFHNPGFGIGAGWSITKNIYIKASFTDVYGDKFEKGDFLDFGPHFFNGKMQTMAEIGWVPSMDERYFKKFSLTYWSAPQYTSHTGAKIEAGSGIAFSSHWFFNENFMPFFRFGISNGNGENLFYKKDVQIGSGYLLKSHDLIGLSFSIAETNIPESKNQLTSELFYRFHVTQHLAITPDLQYIINPTLNPSHQGILYFAIRGRVTF